MKPATLLWTLLLALCGLAALTPIANTAPLAIPSELDQGKRVFAMNCSVGYCHGLEGRAGKGPRLRGRVWSRSYLYNTIQKGVPNSSMPAWQGRLADRSIDAVVAYILSIAQQQPDAGTSAGSKEFVPSSQPLSKQAEFGKALFFDPTQEKNCGICHRVAGSGTAVAAAFDNLASREDQDLLRQILEPPGNGNVLELTTTEGEVICGVKAGETSGSVQIYDLASPGPPVLRTLGSDSIRKAEPCPGLNPHESNSRSFSTQELLDIVAFLKSLTSSNVR